MARHQASTTSSNGLVQIVRRQANLGSGRGTRYEIILSGDGHQVAADIMADELRGDGHDPQLTSGNGAVQLSYVVLPEPKRVKWEFEGEMLSLAEISERKGMHRNTMSQRIQNMGFSAAMNRPKMPTEERRKLFGRLLHATAKEFGQD